MALLLLLLLLCFVGDAKVQGFVHLPHHAAKWSSSSSSAPSSVMRRESNIRLSPSFATASASMPSPRNNSLAGIDVEGRGIPPSQTTRVPPKPVPNFDILPEAPGPRPYPFVGNMLKVLKLGGVHNFDAAMAKKYGRVVKTRILGVTWYILSDPADCRDVFVGRLKEFETRFVAPQLANLFGNHGIIFANGEEWASNRRLSLPAFHRSDILDMASGVVTQIATQVAKRYERLEAGSIVDVNNDMKSLTLEAVCLASFSLPLGLQEDTTSDKQTQTRGRRVDYLVRKSFALMGPSIRFAVPGAHKVGLNLPFRKLKKIMKELNQVQDQIINDRRAQRAAIRAGGGPPPVSKDLLDVYLEAIEAGEVEGGVEKIDNESIRKNIHDILLAGSDTTATTIAATLFELAKNPAVKAKVMAELEALDVNNPQHMLPTQLPQRLPYLESCIKETLRFYPVAANLARIATLDTQMGGYKIPKGSIVSPAIRVIQLDPKNWGPDAHVFKPERWQGEMEGGLPVGVPAGSYIPFGAGPRVCLGLRFALMEAMIVTSVLLKTVDLSLQHPDQELQPYYPAALGFRDGIKLVVNPLKKE